MIEQRITVTLLTGEDEMLGRECPNDECGRFFKLKPGTGLNTQVTHCPYCGVSGDPQSFATEDQIEYAKSIALKQLVEPLFSDFDRLARDFNRRQRGGIVSLRIDVSSNPIQVHRYVERDLETPVTCDNCGLEFTVYGVFASCPDCQRLNALTTCMASVESARNRVRLSDDERIDADVRQQFPQDALGAAVSAFDSYGKALRARFPSVLSASAKSNLFQDVDSLDRELLKADLPDLASLVGPDGVDQIRWLFQARHLYQHSAGVVDARFVNKLPAFERLMGQLLPLPHAELTAGIDALERLVREIDQLFKADRSGSP